MTEQEAIKEIEMILEEATSDEHAVCYVTSCDEEALKMAIKSLEKQIPKKPIIWEEKYYDSPVPNDNWGYECPCCGNRDIDYPEHHCTCGQTIDWSEEE